jgi:hypothetical protein
MMSPKDADDPKHWRERAAQMRALANTMKDAETIAIMNRLADDYDKLADVAEQRARPKGRPRPKGQNKSRA